MLTHLFINNYALIDSLEIDFREGFTTITGETGAGKSILLGALSLILGQRADTQVLLDKSKKCIVEGTFRVKDYGFDDFFFKNELEYDNEVIIRREISPIGKSRTFINDTPVNLDVLKEIGEMLVDIHSQHKTLTIQESKFQLDFIDSYVQHDNLLFDFKKEFIHFNTLKSELSVFLEKEKQSKTDLDYFNFQFEELSAAKLIAGEQEELEKVLEILNHAEEIKLNLNKISASLSSGDFNLISGLIEANSTINKLSVIYPVLSEIAERLNSCCIELKDISGEIEAAEQKVIYSSEKISEINERLDVLYHLQQKHRVNSVTELLDIQNNIMGKLSAITSLDEHIEKINNQIHESEKKLATLTSSITKNRKKALPHIEKGVLEILKKLAMPDACFSVNLTQLAEYNNSGKDKAVFLFNANKGGEKKELYKVASGGELSRLMLSIKSLISEKKLLPTIIFDEIDQGVSGDIADKAGNIMKKMSDTMQVIVITHLPQIAVKGSSHFLVYKEINKNSASTRIKMLSENERISEIAKMLSGNELTKAALENAKVLLKN
ncbi:MAG: DNA repair protein RecN [Bacteroidetes bacterium]|nr:DNA repair protein RecN [Bacteroidota bacterium]